MKLSIKFIFLLSICFLLSRCGDNAEQQAASELSEIVTDFNTKCPQMIDSETRIDGLSYTEPNTLTYKYTLVNLNVMNVDTHQFYLAMWPGLLSTIRVSAEMKKLRDNNAMIQYYYADKNSKPVYLFKITPKDYK